MSDTDKDGVIDEWDECPDSRIGTTVDSNGCPRASDECYTDINPAGTCADSDLDGVIDMWDECNTQTLTCPFVFSNGCSVCAEAEQDENNNIHIPVLFVDKEGLFGAVYIWADLEFFGLLEGYRYYKLTRYGKTSGSGEECIDATLTEDLNIYLPAQRRPGLSGGACYDFHVKYIFAGYDDGSPIFRWTIPYEFVCY